MRFRIVGCVATLMLAACSGGEGLESDLGESKQNIVGPSTLGGRNEVVMIYARAYNAAGQLVTRTCTGSYFAPRVVLTAAHCLVGIFADQLFVYHGDNFNQDLPQLVPGPNGLMPPPPGQSSLWAQADSFESHPSYDPVLHHPDMGVIYLDRKLPFDPLPLYRVPVAANRSVTISGWGANSAPTPTSGAGSRVQRTGTTRTLGSPTAADYHPEDPNAGMLNAAIRAQVIKTDGRAPNANGCFGDSGGPLLLTESGQTYIAAVGYFTGLSCLDYNLFVRLNPFLPFLDQAYKKGGQETLVPSFECVAPNAQGSLTAFFSYNNRNGVSVSVPYGTRNTLVRDTNNWRPQRFLPGQHRFAFSVDFTTAQTVTWKLSPDNSPTTTLNVNQASKRCGAAEFDQAECGLACRASQRSGCANLPSFEQCLQFCMETSTFISQDFPACVPENSAINSCIAGLSPTPSNWECFDDFGAFPASACNPQFEARDICFSQGQ